jgi:dihydrodipicolinate synthase/N-acetylneuraminate lyase
VLYNVPGRTAVTLAPDTVLRLAEDTRFIAIKQAVPDLDQATAILRGRPGRFAFLSGEDSLTLPMIALGADGVVGVIPNEVPGAFVAMVRAALAGHRAEAAHLHGQLFGLMKANFIESNPIPVKFALSDMALIEPFLRTPMTLLAEKHRATVRRALQQARVIETTTILERGATDAVRNHPSNVGV